MLLQWLSWICKPETMTGRHCPQRKHSNKSKLLPDKAQRLTPPRSNTRPRLVMQELEASVRLLATSDNSMVRMA